MGIPERIAEIEAEIARTQKNKKTEHHIGMLKARMARLKLDMSTTKTSTSSGDGFEVKKSGDARVSLVGFPSVGKSTLLSKITSTESRAAMHEFTTLTCIPGRLEYNNSTIQILDLPGIIPGASKGKGRGKQVISVARTSDLILIVLDPKKPEQKQLLVKELESMEIRINKKIPNLTLTPTKAGGISINRTYKYKESLEDVTDQTITMILKEYKINNCILLVKEKITTEDLIDFISKRAVYIKTIFCYNKIDMLNIKQIDGLSKEENTIVISSHKEWNLDELLCEIWDKLELRRIYTKKKGEFPDLEKPIVIKKFLIKDLCAEIHRAFIDEFKYALVWGKSAKHNPQKVGLNHTLEDEDVVQIYTN